MPPKNKDTRKTNESPSAASGNEEKSSSENEASGNEEKSSSENEVVKKKDEAGGKEKKSSSKDGAGGKGKKSSREDEDSSTEEITVSISCLSTASRTKVVKKKDEASGNEEKSSSEDEAASRTKVVKKKDEAGGKGKKSSSKDGGTSDDFLLELLKSSSTAGGKKEKFTAEDLEEFIKTKIQCTSCKKTWCNKTYLIVKCTTTDGNMELHYYTNYTGGRHAEEIFTEDLKKIENSPFLPNSTFELYMNYTPCNSCSKLLKPFTGRVRAINAVAIFYEGEEDTQLKPLNDKGILIKPLGKKEFLEFIPQECSDALTRTFQKYDKLIEERDTSTARRLLKILKPNSSTSGNITA